jgi:hypothetical protein
MRMLACQLYVLGVDLCLKRANGMSLGASSGIGAGLEFSQGCFTRRLTTAELVLTPKSKVAQVITQMWETLGDRIALQYGGSEAHKKVTGQAVSSGGENGKKNKRKTAEVMTSIRRYYSNSFTDRPKQDAMNLFLGMFQPMSVRQDMEELEAVMESRTWDDDEGGGSGMTLPRRSKSIRRRKASTTSRTTRDNVTTAAKKQDGQSTGSDGTSTSRRMFHFQHIWELEGDSLPSDFYLHNKRTMEGRRSDSLDSILAAFSDTPDGRHAAGPKDPAVGQASSKQASSPSSSSAPLASFPSVPPVPGANFDHMGAMSTIQSDSINRSDLISPAAPFKSVHDLPYFQKANESMLKEDWWTLPLDLFEERAERALISVKLPLLASRPVGEGVGWAEQGTRTDAPPKTHASKTMHESLIAFDSLKIASSVTSGFPNLLELEADIVGHDGSMAIGRVHDYESLRMSPRDFGLPSNAPSLVADMRRAYEDLRAPSLRALGIYCGGDLDSPALANRADLLAEVPVMWQHRRRKPGARVTNDRSAGESKFEYSRVHLLQQFWSVPGHVSAGLVVAPEKDWNSCHGVIMKASTTGDARRGAASINHKRKSEKVVSGGGGTLKSAVSRSSVFHGVLETFGLRGSGKEDGKMMLQVAQDGVGGAKEDNDAPKLADLAIRLSPELPIDGNDITDYQEYVSRGHNSWHEGLRAEEALFEELRGYDNGMPNKRILEIFRHTKYLHADPHDLEAMRMVQSAGGATLVIKHGVFRGLRQDSPAVETKAALESLLWSFETVDNEPFVDSVQI